MKTLKKNLILGITLLGAFIAWTLLIQTVDVKPLGLRGTEIGFATFNVWFHQFAGVHMGLYRITDWLGLVPVLVCFIFGCFGFLQLIKRRSIFKVDYDILLLGGYYILVIAGYLFFEMVPINYRPILINGYMEASYPSSTTLLVLSVMPTLNLQVDRRVRNRKIGKAIQGLSVAFSAFMVVGRLISGVHWFSDIVGACFLSGGVFYLYRGMVLWLEERDGIS